jgi:formylglycine-generating enzyme required for sulfatase activity
MRKTITLGVVNGYGLYDMAGNVTQWCWDLYGTPYAGGTDPHGPANGTYRVLRGGGWDYYAYDCRVAIHDYGTPSNSYNNRGFRSVLSAGQ